MAGAGKRLDIAGGVTTTLVCSFYHHSLQGAAMADQSLTFSIGAGQLTVARGDITTFDGDAVVNAANSRLAGGGGVDGAIHRAAGQEKLQRACRSIIGRIGRLPAGQAVITSGFELPARYIIHTVGPVWRGGGQGEDALLVSAYQKSLEVAHENGAASIAFPAISCGAFGFPVDRAAPLALGTLKNGLEAGLVTGAHMILHSEADWRVWAEKAEERMKDEG